MENRAWAGIGFALFTSGLYGLNVPFVRIAFLNGIPPHEAVLFRGISMMVFSVMAVIVLREAVRLPRQAWPVIICLGISTGLVSLSYSSAVRFISVGLSSIIFYTYPLIILIASPIGDRRPIGWQRLVLAFLAFAGLALALGPSLQQLDWRGIALALLASVGAAVHAYLGRHASRWMSDLTNIFWTHLILVPTVMVTAFVINGGIELTAFTGTSVTLLGVVAVATMCAAYIMGYMAHMRALRLAPAAITAPFFNLEPVVVVIIAAVLLGEKLDLNQYAGGALVIVALSLSSLVRDKKRVVAERMIG